MKKFFAAWLGVLILLGAPLGARAGLKLGDQAPGLSGLEWVKGKPVNLADGKGKQAYVVEFWATWCAPCLETIPHLSELNKKSGSSVTFVGVSTEAPDVIKPFVAKMGDKMNYNVLADKENQTFDAFMTAVGESGIPHAFLIDRAGELVWYGHPGEKQLETLLAEVTKPDFKFDAAKASAVVNRQNAEQKMLTLASMYETMATLFADDPEAAQLVGKLALKYGDTNPTALGRIIYTIVNGPFDKPDYDLAVKGGKIYMENATKKESRVVSAYAEALEKTNGDAKLAADLKKQAASIDAEAKLDPTVPKPGDAAKAGGEWVPLDGAKK